MQKWMAFSGEKEKNTHHFQSTDKAIQKNVKTKCFFDGGRCKPYILRIHFIIIILLLYNIVLVLPLINMNKI